MPDNPPMTQADTIAKNLTAWMESNPSLDTLKKVATRSGVGFGTVQRLKNGEGNPTRTSLEGVAKAFGRTAEELLRRDAVAYVVGVEAAGSAGTVTPVADPVLTDLATLDPEDADVWRAQIRAAATKARRQRATETEDFAPKPDEDRTSPNLKRMILAIQELASGRQDLPSNAPSSFDTLFSQLPRGDQKTICEYLESAFARTHEAGSTADATEPSILNQIAKRKGLVHETPTTKATGVIKAATAPASISKRVRRTKV